MNDIIESFFNGQHKQMITQVNESYKNNMFEFVQELQDSDLSADQKITILGRVLKSFDK